MLQRVRLRDLLLPVALIVVTMGLTACETVRPVRTLPAWVRGIYIPMFENDTAEPGLEEIGTQLTQEAFLTDGRVRIVQKRDADLILQGRILEYEVLVADFGDEGVAEEHEIRIFADVRLFDPLDPEVPYVTLEDLEIIRSFNSDARSTRYVIKPDANHRLLEELANEIVRQTISGFPAQLRDIPDGVRLPSQQQAEPEEERDGFPFL